MRRRNKSPSGALEDGKQPREPAVPITRTTSVPGTNACEKDARRARIIAMDPSMINVIPAEAHSIQTDRAIMIQWVFRQHQSPTRRTPNHGTPAHISFHRQINPKSQDGGTIVQVAASHETSSKLCKMLKPIALSPSKLPSPSICAKLVSPCNHSGTRHVTYIVQYTHVASLCFDLAHTKKY